MAFTATNRRKFAHQVSFGAGKNSLAVTGAQQIFTVNLNARNVRRACMTTEATICHYPDQIIIDFTGCGQQRLTDGGCVDIGRNSTLGLKILHAQVWPEAIIRQNGIIKINCGSAEHPVPPEKSGLAGFHGRYADAIPSTAPAFGSVVLFAAYCGLNLAFFKPRINRTAISSLIVDQILIAAVGVFCTGFHMPFLTADRNLHCLPK
nr:MAG TPA_asm: hypothetical protein [Caudoviricetes sp.]